VNLNNPKKQIVFDSTRGVYKWSRMWNHFQRNFFVDRNTKLRRDKQIEDFVRLNGYERPWVLKDCDVLAELEPIQVEELAAADIAVITDQRFSRYPCPIIIEKIQDIVEQCPALYLCLNRNYINIDNSYHDATLSDNFNRAITQWLQKNLPYDVVDLSLDYDDFGNAFTWVIPDRHYFIRRNIS